jgi:glutathione synthase/RimK-type ligase-like ATP-grasp enzyme
MRTILLLGAGGSAASNFLAALRLSSRSYRVIGADCSPVRLHLADTDERVVVPRAGATGYLEALVGLVDAFGVELVHAQPDPDVRALGAMRKELRTRTFLPSQDALELAQDKAVFARTLVAAGVSVPEFKVFSSRDEVAAGTEALLAEHSRVWIRARVGAGSRASLPVRTAEQALAWVDWWVAERGMSWADFMASEFLPGREFAYESVWAGGELVAGQARERVEYLYGHLTPSGQTSTPALARTVSEPSVDKLAQEAVRAIDLEPQGVYCVDMKEDAGGTTRVTEVNAGRFFTTSNFFATAGLNLPELFVRCALGDRLEPVGSSPLPPDLFWIRMVDMGYRLVPGDDLDPWARADC